MKYALLEWLACPACRHASFDLETRSVRNRAQWRGEVQEHTAGYDSEAGDLREVEEGDLRCLGCGQSYPIVEGIPLMVLGEPQVARSAHARTRFDHTAPEWERAFLDFCQPLGPDEFLGKLALDVGCGFGRGLHFSARFGAEVVGVDLDLEVLRAARANTLGQPRVHLVQGDAACLPFRTEVFDLVYAFGLLHHVEDADHVFQECSARVKPGGRFSTWAYGPRQGTAAALSALLRGMTREMPSEELLNVSRLIATVLRVASHTPYKLLRRVPGMHSLVSHLPMHDHYRWPYHIVVADIYDRLRIPVRRTFTREELEARYVDEGYLDVYTTRRVRNNESFRATGIRR